MAPVEAAALHDYRGGRRAWLVLSRAGENSWNSCLNALKPIDHSLATNAVSRSTLPVSIASPPCQFRTHGTQSCCVLSSGKITCQVVHDRPYCVLWFCVDPVEIKPFNCSQCKRSNHGVAGSTSSATIYLQHVLS